MNIIILGDKYEKGMKSKGCQALIQYSPRISMVSHQIKKLSKNFFDISNIVYVYGLEGKQFMSSSIKHNMVKIYNPNYADTNYAYSLSVAKNFLNDSCLVIFGDTKLDKINFKCLNLDLSCVFTEYITESLLGCIQQQNVVLNIAIDLPEKINDKIFFLCKKDALKVEHLLEKVQNHNNFIFELINKIIDDNSKVIINKKKKRYEKN